MQSKPSKRKAPSGSCAAESRLCRNWRGLRKGSKPSSTMASATPANKSVHEMVMNRDQAEGKRRVGRRQQLPAAMYCQRQLLFFRYLKKSLSGFSTITSCELLNVAL